jgi:serine/threonine protein kinase
MNIFDICHGHAFDEMDTEMETMAYSHEDFLQPIKCTLADVPTADTRCISNDSDDVNCTIDIPSSPTTVATVTQEQEDGYSNIFDEYIVLPTILGTGNYGCVRECQHRSTGQIYAVKTIDKSKVGRLDHIRREIQFLRSVNHSSIMKMVDCYEDADYVHIVTEKYTGGELFDKIVDNTHDYGCLSEKEAAKIIKSLLESVQYLHSRNIVHRDIKPENVLFESNEEGSSIKLIDFGLARIHASNDGSYMTNQVGTPYYMSPDILKGKYDRSCDIWAIGITAYILLSGYPPFNGGSDTDVHRSIRKGNLVFEKSVWGNLSKASRDFVSKLLCMDSSKIPSASEALQHPWIRSA